MTEQKRRKFDSLQIINAPSKTKSETEGNLVLQNLSAGDRVQLLPISGRVSYAQYIGHTPGISLLVTTPKTLDAFKGQILNVRILLQGNLYSFQSTIISLNQLPIGYIHLNYPSNVQVKAIREETRVSVMLDVQVEGQKEFANGKTTSQAIITDMSNGGASIEAPVQLGILGDKMTVTANIKTDEFEKKINIPCSICQVRGWEDAQTKELTVLHGIKFEFPNKEDQDFVEKYVAQQILYAQTCKII